MGSPTRGQKSHLRATLYWGDEARSSRYNQKPKISVIYTWNIYIFVFYIVSKNRCCSKKCPWLCCWILKLSDACILLPWLVFRSWWQTRIARVAWVPSRSNPCWMTLVAYNENITKQFTTLMLLTPKFAISQPMAAFLILLVSGETTGRSSSFGLGLRINQKQLIMSMRTNTIYNTIWLKTRSSLFLY